MAAEQLNKKEDRMSYTSTHITTNQLNSSHVHKVLRKQFTFYKIYTPRIECVTRFYMK